MKEIIFLITIIFSISNCFSQDFELRITPFIKSKVNYKDGSSETGFLRLASSAFKPRFKKTKNEKERKIDFEQISSIVTNPQTEKERVFEYLNHNYNKFKIFAELVYSDVLSIYVSSSTPDNLFYSDFNRKTIGEMMAKAKSQNVMFFQDALKKPETIKLANGQEVTIPTRYKYFYGTTQSTAMGITPNLTYYLLKKDGSKLYRAEKNRRFLKRAKGLIGNCSELIKALEEKTITLKNDEDLPIFIEYYKDTCLGNSEEMDE